MIYLPIPAALARSTDFVKDVEHEKSLVYGQARGHNLMLDVFRPLARPRRRALLVMVSGGYMSNHQTLSAIAPLLRRIAHEAGYTIFGVLHGVKPTFLVEDIAPQITRAVRFVRHHAGRFEIDPEHIGILGFSSGGYLSLMAGVSGEEGDPSAADPVERASSRVQAVVAFFPPTDFLNYGAEGRLDMGHGPLSPLRRAFVASDPPLEEERALARRISPIYRVSAQAAPTLLIHGDRDGLVPLQQSERFHAAMQRAGAESRLRVKPGAAHGWGDMLPDLHAAMEWLDRHLAGERRKPALA